MPGKLPTGHVTLDAHFVRGLPGKLSISHVLEGHIVRYIPGKLLSQSRDHLSRDPT